MDIKIITTWICLVAALLAMFVFGMEYQEKLQLNK
jgi:hypothetical protein